MNIYDIILVLLIGTAVVFAVTSIVKSHKNGGCCGGCNGCPHSGRCGKK